jgi:ligand-binding sensor domain-containing protein
LPIEELNARGMEPSILSILRDQDLRLWLGLERDGILMDDGRNWHFYGTESGLGAGPDLEHDFRVRRLIQDSQGNIWAVIGVQGLNYYDPAADDWKRILVSSEFETISDVAELGPGELWVAGQNDDGAAFVAHHSVSANPAEIPDGSWLEAGPGQGLVTSIHGLAQSDDGAIWIGSYEGGVSVFDGQNWTHLQR